MSATSPRYGWLRLGCLVACVVCATQCALAVDQPPSAHSLSHGRDNSSIAVVRTTAPADNARAGGATADTGPGLRSYLAAGADTEVESIVQNIEGACGAACELETRDAAATVGSFTTVHRLCPLPFCRCHVHSGEGPAGCQRVALDDRCVAGARGPRRRRRQSWQCTHRCGAWV